MTPAQQVHNLAIDALMLEANAKLDLNIDFDRLRNTVLEGTPMLGQDKYAMLLEARELNDPIWDEYIEWMINNMMPLLISQAAYMQKKKGKE